MSWLFPPNAFGFTAADVPWLLWCGVCDAFGVPVTTAARAGTPLEVQPKYDGRREISLDPGPVAPPPKRSDPPVVKLGTLALQKLENLVLIGCATVVFREGLCTYEQWMAVLALAVGVAAFGPKLSTLTRGAPVSIGGLIARWWSR
jgi:hypothetical protein